MEQTQAKAYKEIIDHAFKAKGTKPSKSWVEKAKKLVETAGHEKFKGYVKGWFELTKIKTITKPTEEQLKLLEYLKNTPAANFRETMEEIFQKTARWHFPDACLKLNDEETKEYVIKDLRIKDREQRFTERNSNVLKGLAWFCAYAIDDEIIKSLRDLAIQCYTTIPEVGPLAAGAGNACIYTLTESTSTASLAALQKLEHKIKNANLQKVIRKAYEEVSRKLGVNKDELEEMGMEEFGFGENNLCERKIGKHTASISITNEGKTTIMWVNDKGNPTLEIEAAQIKVIFEVESDFEAEKSESVGFWTYLISGNIVFKNFEGDILKIKDVPPIIFSEVMRDIDLFVSIAGTVRNG